MDSEIRAVQESLRANGFGVRFAADGKAALQMLLEMIPRDAVVGFGDSVTVRGLGLFRELEKRGTKVVRPMIRRDLTSGAVESQADHDRYVDALKKRLANDVYVTGTNAVTLDGKIVNMDGTGNRVAGMVFGAPRVILVIGRNKVVPDVDAALHRIKNSIVPAWARMKGRVLPCAKTGRCHDCNARQPSRRMCSVTTIMEQRPWYTDITVILVDEDLGLGFDPAWPRERINKIKWNCIQQMEEGPSPSRYAAGQAFLAELEADMA